MKNALLFCHVALLLCLSASAVNAGVLDCGGCHAEKNDIRPIDSPYRNMSSGGFIGNHRSHVSEPASFNSCIVCHDNRSYATDHLDGKIQLSNKINNYSSVRGNAHYVTARNTSTASGLVFFNQTSLPVPGRCSNVNCHFESDTPNWGSSVVSCSLCHGAPPAGTSPGFVGGTAGSHARHDTYFSGISNCGTCHSDHLSEPNSYAHSTSAGRRALIVSLHDPLKNPSGTYSKTAVTRYLPSQSAGQTFGSCTNLYCHSPGTRTVDLLPPARAAVWGGTLGCNGCHQTAPVSGSHKAHLMESFAVPVSCNKCHAATVSVSSTIVTPVNHVNMKVDIAFSSFSTSASGTYGGIRTPLQKSPGSTYASCSAVYCHSNGQGDGGTWPPAYSSPKWGDPASAQCGSCHDEGMHNAGPLLKTGSHTQHLRYDFGTGGGENLCGVCHYGNGFVEPDSSCGQCHFKSDALITRHINGQVDVDFVGKFGGSYTGTPQPGDGYGSCSSIYCHSDGTSVSTAVLTTASTARWGTSNSAGCSACHGYPPAYSSGSPKANSHMSHSRLGCGTCHAGTTGDGTTITSFVTHVNKAYDLQPGAGVSFSYVYSPGGGTCSSISCHFNNSATWGGTLKCADCHSVSPGDQ